VVLLLLGLAGAAAAIERLSVSVADMAGPGWRAGAIRMSLSLADGDGGLSLAIGELALAPPLERVTAAVLRCDTVQAKGAALECPQARLTLHLADAAPANVAAALELDPALGVLRLRVREQDLLGGRVRLRLEAGPDGVVADLAATGVDAGWLGDVAGLVPDMAPLVVSTGVLDAQATVRRDAGGGQLAATMRLRGVDFSDATGLHAGEGVDLELRVAAAGQSPRWAGDVEASLRSGTVYLHPILVEAGPQGLSARASATLGDGVLHLWDLQLRDPGVALVVGEARIGLGEGLELLALRAELAKAPVAPLYRRYLRPFAGAGPLADLALDGRAGVRLDWQAGGAAGAVLELDQVSLGDAQGRFALFGLDGTLAWSRSTTPEPARLTWRGMQLGPLALGPATARLALAGNELSLLEPLEATLLDGALRLERLEGRELGRPGQRIEADLSLAPVSLARLSERLAWLPLAGRLGGRVPRLVLTRGRLAVEGDLALELFDGRLRASGLSLEDPFGVVPRLRADLTLEDLDLGLLTRALSFGSIEGRLDGRVTSLVLERWQPVAFDAVFRTPEDDTSRHRISQRALDNLASLGGANAVLSSTFLRVFSEFSYERLGISCRLRAGVCEMGGVEPAPRGYYLVKGGGLPPRVDVVGFNRRVDWQTLLSRLRAVSSARDPVVR
jgi:hypothetical protein